MLILLAISGFVSSLLAALYLYSRVQFYRYSKAQQVRQSELENELNALKTKIQFDSRDPVTQLMGWPLFESRVNHGLKECLRYQFILGVMYVDIDSFKLINNAMGYDIGNQLLFQVAERLQDCIRQADSISRQSKDTFVILLAQLAKQETAAIIIQRMLQALAEPFEINGNKISLTACIGAAFYPADGVTASDLMHNAEYAMLLAKSHGKHTYQFYQERLLAEGQRELALYNSISSDAFLDEIKLVYQPVMNVKEQTLCYLDTQIQWNHHTIGIVSGEELFVYADKHRKLNKITELVLTKACQKFLHWRSLGLNPKMLGIPVLLKQLENAAFIYRLSHIMQELKMQPAWVMFEIRESAAPVSLDILEKSFNMLHYLGVKVTVDRFGSGSFSLRYLRAFSVHYLKLDPALINDISENEQTRTLVKAVQDFAANLSLELIATGVDSDAQAAVLKEINIDIMQGRLVSEPLSETEMAGRMSSV